MGISLKCEYCGNETRLEGVEYSDKIQDIHKFEYIVTNTGKMIIMTCTKCNEEVDIHIR